jgi:hypothetical protein
MKEPAYREGTRLTMGWVNIIGLAFDSQARSSSATACSSVRTTPSSSASGLDLSGRRERRTSAFRPSRIACVSPGTRSETSHSSSSASAYRSSPTGRPDDWTEGRPPLDPLGLTRRGVRPRSSSAGSTRCVWSACVAVTRSGSPLGKRRSTSSPATRTSTVRATFRGSTQASTTRGDLPRLSYLARGWKTARALVRCRIAGGCRAKVPAPGIRRNGRYWARTSDPQLVELVLSQLS